MNLIIIFLLFILAYLIVHFEEFHYYWSTYTLNNARNSRQKFRKSRPDHTQFLELLFAMAAKLCRADGAVQTQEIDKLNDLINARLKLDDQMALKAKRAFSQAKDSTYTFENYLNSFYNSFGHREELLDLAIYFLESVAEVGGLAIEENQLLELARKRFGIKKKTSSNNSQQTYSRKNIDAYQVLGCTPGATKNEIKKQYRRKVMELHPDRLYAKGMSEEFIELARERFIRVQEAYEEIMATK